MENPIQLFTPAKKDILRALKADLRAAEQLKSATDGKIRAWKNAYEGAPYGNEVKGKSTIVSRDIKRQSAWQHASLVDPFVSTPNIIKCYPVTYEDREAAIQNELLLNTQFCRKFPRFNFISKAIQVLDMEGTVVVQTGWEYEGVEEEVEVETIVIDEFGNQTIELTTDTVTRTVINQPTAKICRNEDVYIDPTCQDDMDKAQFFIHRYETDISTLKKDGRYKNLDKISKGSSEYSGDYRNPDHTHFKFQDTPRKKHLVYEYWGNYDMDGDGIAEPIVCAWIDDIIIRLEDNPYPDGKPPFLLIPFNPTPFKAHGEASAELIGDNQKVKTAVLRGIMDNMAQSNNGQVGIRKGALDATNRSRFVTGKNFEFNGTQNDFWQGSYNSIPGSVFDILGLMNNEIESLSGVKGFSQGITGASLGPSATAARGAMDSTAIRRMHIVRSISENLIKPLMRKWIAYNSEFLEEEEVIRVTNGEYVPIRRDDLTGAIDIDISVTTAEDNAAKAQELSFLLQTLGPNEDPDVRRFLMSDIMELMRMPDQAKRIREYQPEPDPVQQQLQQLEVARLERENMLLEAKIANEYARAKDYESAALLQGRKAEVEDSRRRNIDSDTDLKELEFLRLDEDVDGQRKDREFENKRLHDLDMAVIKARVDSNKKGNA